MVKFCLLLLSVASNGCVFPYKIMAIVNIAKVHHFVNICSTLTKVAMCPIKVGCGGVFFFFCIQIPFDHFVGVGRLLSDPAHPPHWVMCSASTLPRR